MHAQLIAAAPPWKQLLFACAVDQNQFTGTVHVYAC